MSVTDNYNLPLPDPSAASAKADVQKIRDALIALDDALANQNVDAYTKSEVDSAIAQAKADSKTETKNELLGGAGAAHDTLQELAAELADDENAITSLTNLVGLKADSSALKALAYRDTVGADQITNKSITPIKMAENILADGTDLNTVIDSGSYRLEANGINWPSTSASYGQLMVSKNSDTIFQMISYYHNNEVHTRTGWGINYAPTFTPWKKLSNNVWEHIATYDLTSDAGAFEHMNLSDYREINIEGSFKLSLDEAPCLRFFENGVLQAGSSDFAWVHEYKNTGGGTYTKDLDDSTFKLTSGRMKDYAGYHNGRFDYTIDNFNQTERSWIIGQNGHIGSNGLLYQNSSSGLCRRQTVADGIRLFCTNSANFLAGSRLVIHGIKG